MTIAKRIEELERDVHTALYNAIGDCDQALDDLEAGRRKWPRSKATPGPAPKRGATPKAPPPRLSNARSTTRLRDTWSELRSELEAHLERERVDVLPICQVVHTDPTFKDNLKSPISQMVAEHVHLRDLLARIRVEVGAVPPVRREFQRMAGLVDEHCRKTESEIFPGALDELTDEVSLITELKQSYATADDVARSLRRVRPPEPKLEQAPDEAKGMLGWLSKYLKR